MTTRAPDEVKTADAARLLGLPLHRLHALIRGKYIEQQVRGRIGLISCVVAYVAALRNDARNLPSTTASTTANRADDRTRRKLLDMEDRALLRLDRMARRADPARRAAIRAAQARIRAARAEADGIMRDA
ncbi:hypothetical protein [Gemmobacter serpentinus]|uniref:hypothetical protein n=1 Tax=Gemmobacter serpentinus TaxID=2652247 RepID=UPI00124ED669|nr:hypothetical protein [Gemmobacter serpentinus]